MSHPSPWADGSAQASRPIRSELNTPEIKACTGLTYEHLCQALEKTTRFKTYRQLLDMLYSTVRLRQWEPAEWEPGVEATYQIINTKKTIRVSVTMKAVEVTKGLRHFKVAEGLEATALFNSIKHAQELIKEAMKPLEDNTADDDFFQPLSEEEQARQMDAVLTDKSADQSATEPETEEYSSMKDDPKKRQPTMDEDRVQRHLKSLQGRVLTIMEAILADKQQREAVKTIVNKEFRREMEKVAKHFLDPLCDQTDEE